MALVVIAESGKELAERLAAGLEDRGLSSTLVPTLDGVAAAVSDDTRILLVGPSTVAEDAIAYAQRRPEGLASLAMVLLSRDVDAAVFRQALAAGLSDVIAAEAARVEEVVDAVAAAVSRLDIRVCGDADAEREGRVVMVQSTKGGVGKTMFASNLAVTLARLGKKVVLVDLDLESGDVGLSLKLDPTRTLSDVLQAFDRLDRDLVDKLLVTHSSGLKVLLAPVRLEDLELVTMPRIVTIIDLLKTIFEIVVLDTGAAFDDVALTAADKSDIVYTMATMDVASVKNARISIQRLRQLGHMNGMVRLVLNRADSKVWLEAAEVERSVGTKISVRIPSDRLVPRSLNKGVPVVVDAPRSAVAKSIVAAADGLIRESGD